MTETPKTNRKKLLLILAGIIAAPIVVSGIIGLMYPTQMHPKIKGHNISARVPGQIIVDGKPICGDKAMYIFGKTTIDKATGKKIVKFDTLQCESGFETELADK